ncbi:hypothetical protein H7F33_12830 [Pedobacter sp. PAMC26386]|nr:hypothetical protein H7F33_12830 [Pedobacter sp. PAMC26386]
MNWRGEMEVLGNGSKRSILGGREMPQEQIADTPNTFVGGTGGGYNSDGRNSGFTNGYGLGGFTVTGRTPSMDNSSAANPSGNDGSTGSSSYSPRSDSGGGYLFDNQIYKSISGDSYAKISFNGGQTWTNQALVQVNTGTPGWQSALNALLGVGEVAIGALGAIESGGVTTFLIIYGSTRIATNFADLLKPGAGASNLVALIGRGFNGATGEKYGALINDGVTAVISGGAVAGAYFMLDAANSTYSAYQYSGLR